MKRRFPDLTKAKLSLFKQGPSVDFEFKKKMEQIVDVTKNETQEEIKPTIKPPLVRLEDYAKELERENANLKKQLLESAPSGESRGGWTNPDPKFLVVPKWWLLPCQRC